MQKDERYYQAYLSHNQISRRSLLRGLFVSAEKPLTRNVARNAPRPPFAAKEDLFLHVCDGCGDCVTACELGLISVEKGKAQLDLSYSACTLCGDCARACTRNALHPAFRADTELRPIFQSHCLVRNNQPCTDCQTACPQQAIAADLTLNQTICNGCGECKLACFMGAVELRLPS